MNTNIVSILSKYPQPICPLKHSFSDGVYVREVTMPADSLLVGKTHRTKHLNMISKGSCILLDRETGKRTLIQAPYTFESEAGVSKVVYIIEECVWSTIHVTDETDLDKLEELLIQKEVEHGIHHGRNGSIIGSY